MLRLLLLVLACSAVSFAQSAPEILNAQWPACPVTAGRVFYSALAIHVSTEGKVESTEPLAGDPAFLNDADDAVRKLTFPNPIPGSALGLFCVNGARARLGYIFDPQALQVAKPPVRISRVVAESNLLSKVAPTHPAMAKARNIQGLVVLDAVLSQKGDVAALVPISGPRELLHSAVEALRQWKYKPFLLKGNPVTVETEIHVQYSLNH